MIEYKAIKELWDGEFMFSGLSDTREEFNEAFRPVIGVDNTGTNVFEVNPSNFPITWEQFNAKRNELVAAEPLRLLRIERDKKLIECDWTQFPDVPEPTRLAWQDYRQALRDITNTYTSLNGVVWPEKPE
jgi:uncharacterized short protein YbdD (DUF466 family)